METSNTEVLAANDSSISMVEPNEDDGPDFVLTMLAVGKLT